MNAAARKKTSTIATRGKVAGGTGPTISSSPIEQKVLKLLNSMQVVSEHIDVEMATLNIHLSETTVQHSSETIQYRWIRKAEEKIREK